MAKIIVVDLLLNALRSGIKYEVDFKDDRTFYLDISRNDFRKYADARIKITFKDKE